MLADSVVSIQFTALLMDYVDSSLYTSAPHLAVVPCDSTTFLLSKARSFALE